MQSNTRISRSQRNRESYWMKQGATHRNRLRQLDETRRCFDLSGRVIEFFFWVGGASVRGNVLLHPNSIDHKQIHALLSRYKDWGSPGCFALRLQGETNSMPIQRFVLFSYQLILKVIHSTVDWLKFSLKHGNSASPPQLSKKQNPPGLKPCIFAIKEHVLRYCSYSKKKVQEWILLNLFSPTTQNRISYP